MSNPIPNSLAAQGLAVPERRDAILNRHSNLPSNSSPGGGKSTGQLVRHSNAWRDSYNPLRQLVISKIVALLEAGERGDFAELQWTNRKVEKRYPILKGLKTRWETALEEMDWDIKVVDKLPEGATEAMAEAQQKFLRSRYELVENLTEAIGFLASADFRGYAILQKHRYDDGRNDGAVREFHWLPQWNFARDGQFGDYFYNPEFSFGATPQSLGEANRIGGEQLPRSEFLIREVDSPLFEIALIAFVNWAMGRKDWAACVEVFGLLKAIVIMPPNIPQGKEEEYRVAAEKVSDGVAGALPNGSDAKFPAAEARNNTPFKEFCDAQDADVVMAGTGGLLTMLTAPKGGLGDGPSEQHDDAFKKVGRAVARKINQTLQRDFDKIELAEAFPGQPCLAYFELAAIEEEDAQAVITVAATAAGIGLQADAEELSTKTGLKLERAESPVDTNYPGAGDNSPSPGGEGRDDGGRGFPFRRPTDLRNREDTHPSTPQSQLVAALAAKVDPITAMLSRISSIPDDAQMLAALKEFYANADALNALVTADVSRVASAIEQITAPALADGLAAKQKP